MKFITIVWKNNVDVKINVSSSYELCRLIWLNWQSKQYRKYNRNFFDIVDMYIVFISRR